MNQVDSFVAFCKKTQLKDWESTKLYKKMNTDNLYLECFCCKQACYLRVNPDSDGSFLDFDMLCSTPNCSFKAFSFYADRLNVLTFHIGEFIISIDYYTDQPTIEISYTNIHLANDLYLYNNIVHDDLGMNGFKLFDSLFNYCHSDDDREKYIKNLLLIN